MKTHAIDPKDYGIEYQDMYISTANNQKLHGWSLSQKGRLRGTILYFHGNAENISTHIGSVYWLVEYGFRVLLIDYRGYGKSEGNPTLEGTFKDIQHSIEHTIDNYDKSKPFVIIGQSLGASMSIYTVAKLTNKQDIDALILISPFSDYQNITQEILAKSWLTWLVQIPLSWTITNDYNPSKFIASVNPIPVFFIHGLNDQLIGPEHSIQLHELANPPKDIFLIPGGHNTMTSLQEFKKTLLKVLKEIANASDT